MHLPAAIGPMRTHDPRHIRLAATVAVLPVLAILLLFLVAEVAGGDRSGFGHLLQMAPLVVALVVAWRFPLAGGTAIVAISLVMIFVYPVFAANAGLSLAAVVLVELLLLLPPLAAGVLFVLAGRIQEERLSRSDRPPGAARRRR